MGQKSLGGGERFARREERSAGRRRGISMPDGNISCRLLHICIYYQL